MPRARDGGRAVPTGRMGVAVPQPLLHDLLVSVAAPTQVWAGRDGQIRVGGAQGVFHSDVRVLSAAVLTVDGQEPEPISVNAYGANDVGVIGLVRSLDAAGADPTFRVDRRRHVTPGRVYERITVATGGSDEVQARVRLTLGCDLARINVVKAGLPVPTKPATVDGDDLRWTDGAVTSALSADGGLLVADDLRSPAYDWNVSVRAGRPAVLEWRLDANDPVAAVEAPPSAAPEWAVPLVHADDRRLSDLLAVALDDLAGLRLVTPDDRDNTFLAAGAPWFFTLFGRDALWAARFLLPLGTALAGGTLRALARRQGQCVDLETAEEPGKIMHELRRDDGQPDDATEGHPSFSLPPLYYGTVDATPLWICLLHDAWKWGMPADEVRELLPNLRAALAWMSDYGDADGDGLLEYIDRSGRGLTNQGWKDSHDAVQWRDGRLADAPIALAEVQAYAYEAALGGAAMLDALGDDAGDAAASVEWRQWAERLAKQFRAQYWVSDAIGDYPAIALDVRKQPVDSLTSNIGHLVGTGLLNADESALIAQRLISTELNSGFGIRTLGTASAGYWPLRYHGGTVWTHDTAIAITGLVRAGHRAEAAALAANLVDAAPAFGFRLPELFGGDSRAEVTRPTPYPASCRPQAWAAAAAIAVLSATLGLVPDVPAGRLEVRPASPAPFGAVEVSGLVVAGAPLSVAVDAAGTVRAVAAPGGLDVDIS